MANMQGVFDSKAPIETSPTRGKPVILQQRDSDHISAFLFGQISGKYKDAKIHVGREFQADIPELQRRGADESKEREMCVWSPYYLTDQHEETSRYVVNAKNTHGFAEEQALAFLHFHKYNVKGASDDLKNYTHCPTQWSIEDQIAFSEAFSYTGKNFVSIKKLMPHKTLGDLVTYYYKWKKNRNVISSVMERHHREQDLNQQKILGRGNTENGSDGRSSDSDCDYPRMRQRYSKRRAVNRCQGEPSSKKSKRTGNSSNAVDSGNNSARARLRPPRNFHLNVESFRNFTTVSQSDTEVSIKNLVNEAKELRSQIQQYKQKVERQTSAVVDAVSSLRPPTSLRCSTSQWSRTEIFLFIEAYKRYGKEFTKIAEIISTKTANQVESFYLNVRRRYKLDDVRIGADNETSETLKKQTRTSEKLK